VKRTDGPADTRMMGIVHGALLRDLTRAREVLAQSPPPSGAQRRALGEHLVWMMHFLHAHHTSEDQGLWPLLLERNPAAATLVDSLERDHAQIAPAAEAVRAMASAYAGTTDDAPRVALSAALDRLEDALAPHLEREVAEAMPVVARSLTQQEWDEVEQKFNVSSKSMAQLAMEGQWLLDGIDPEGRDVVVHLVPPAPRLILVHGFAWKYRRLSAACWSPVTPKRSALVR
jgi:hemerythrin-like domain-containing protein